MRAFFQPAIYISTNIIVSYHITYIDSYHIVIHISYHIHTYHTSYLCNKKVVEYRIYHYLYYILKSS